MPKSRYTISLFRKQRQAMRIEAPFQTDLLWCGSGNGHELADELIVRLRVCHGWVIPSLAVE